MSYRTDYDPINYLKRRVKYYKKKKGSLKKWLTRKRYENSNLKNRMTFKEVCDATRNKMKFINNMMLQYERAIHNLESINKIR